MKTFIIIHNLIAGSGFKITLVKAENKETALVKYKEKYPDRWHLGIKIEEVTEDVYTLYHYDNPEYDG
jgi:hypothetical protein